MFVLLDSVVAFIYFDDFLSGLPDIDYICQWNRKSRASVIEEEKYKSVVLYLYR